MRITHLWVSIALAPLIFGCLRFVTPASSSPGDENAQTPYITHSEPSSSSEGMQENTSRNETLGNNPLVQDSLTIAQAYTSLEQDIITETNRVRTNPSAYIPVLQAWRQQFEADGYQVEIRPRVFLQTQEGVAAVDEAIEFLRQVDPVGRLTAAPGLAQAARDHVQVSGPSGRTGHEGPKGGPQARIEQHGRWSGVIGENISYGRNPTGQQVVMQLIIDDGVPSRGHRDNIFSDDFQVTGVACGDHAYYGTMCVIEYATAFSRFGDISQGGTRTSQALQVVNNGTVALESLLGNGRDLLRGNVLEPGQSRSLELDTRQGCEVSLVIQLRGPYQAKTWENLDLCRYKTLTIEPDNSLKLSS